MDISHRPPWPRLAALAFTLLVLLVLAPPAAADLNHYIRIEGATQGIFPGGSDVTPFEGWTVGFEYHHLIERPAPATSTQHQTVISTFSMEEPLIPHLLRALEADESLTVTFRFFRPGGGGAQEEYATVTLSGARIVSLEPLSTDDQDPALASYKATVRARFSYSTLDFKHVPTDDTAGLTNSGS